MFAREDLSRRCAIHIPICLVGLTAATTSIYMPPPKAWAKDHGKAGVARTTHHPRHLSKPDLDYRGVGGMEAKIPLAPGPMPDASNLSRIHNPKIDKPKILVKFNLEALAGYDVLLPLASGGPPFRPERSAKMYILLSATTTKTTSNSQYTYIR